MESFLYIPKYMITPGLVIWWVIIGLLANKFHRDNGNETDWPMATFWCCLAFLLPILSA
jgi:hypothetical protein